MSCRVRRDCLPGQVDQTVYMKLGLQRDLIRANNKWITGSFIQDTAKDQGWKYTGNRGLYGKTVGFLGYGHIARETARLFKAFHCKIIAANSNGTKRPSEGVSCSLLNPCQADNSTRPKVTEIMMVSH